MYLLEKIGLREDDSRQYVGFQRRRVAPDTVHTSGNPTAQPRNNEASRAANARRGVSGQLEGVLKVARLAAEAAALGSLEGSRAIFWGQYMRLCCPTCTRSSGQAAVTAITHVGDAVSRNSGP